MSTTSISFEEILMCCTTFIEKQTIEYNYRFLITFVNVSSYIALWMFSALVCHKSASHDGYGEWKAYIYLYLQ